MAGSRQPLPQPKEAGRAIEKPKKKGKGKGKSGGKAKGKGKGLKCYVCGGIGHPARLCASEGWVNDLEQDTPEGEDTSTFITDRFAHNMQTYDAQKKLHWTISQIVDQQTGEQAWKSKLNTS